VRYALNFRIIRLGRVLFQFWDPWPSRLSTVSYKSYQR